MKSFLLLLTLLITAATQKVHGEETLSESVANPCVIRSASGELLAVIPSDSVLTIRGQKYFCKDGRVFNKHGRDITDVVN